MERATGIEPASEAWEASILPMNYARNSSSRRNRPVDHIVTPDGRATGVGWAQCGSAAWRVWWRIVVVVWGEHEWRGSQASWCRTIDTRTRPIH